MNCEEAHELIFSGSEGAALADHLRGCAACAAISAAHARASALRGDLHGSDAALRPLELNEIQRRVGQRRAARVGLASAAALAFLFFASRHPAAPASSALEASAVASQLDVAQLADEVEGFAHEDVAVDDPTYSSFGPMASWFALPESHGCSAAQPLSVDCLNAPGEDFPE